MTKETPKSAFDNLSEKDKVIVEAIAGIKAQKKVEFDKDMFASKYESLPPEARANHEKEAKQFIDQECKSDKVAKQLPETLRRLSRDDAMIAKITKTVATGDENSFYHGLACQKAEDLKSPSSRTK